MLGFSGDRFVSIVAVSMAFLVTVLFMLVLRPVAEALQLLDHPGGRKRHDGPIPLIGGIAMCIGLTFGMVLTEQPTIWAPIALAIYLLVVVGTVDDRFDLPPRVKLIGQACSALLVVFAADLVVRDLGAPFFYPVALGPFSEIFTILFVITLINAFNVVDGIDGLAGGLAFLALIALAIVGIDTNLLTLVLILVAVVAGFLLFNLPLKLNRGVHAFMGDAGSTFLGLVIAAIGIELSQGTTAVMSPSIGLWFIAVPVFDLFSAAVRRVLRGKSPFAPDHEHLHHALIMAGLSRRETLVFMLSAAVVFSMVGLAGREAHVPDGVMVAFWMAANVLYYQAMRRPDLVRRTVRAVRQIAPHRIGSS